MALPEGITTATVTAGVPVTHSGGAVKTFVSIEPSVFLVHTATGTPLVDFLEELTIAEGVAGQFILPHTDQAGFQDENGNAYVNWYYTARVTYSSPSKSKTKPPKIKVFQLATGQTIVDLDKLPGGAPALPYTAPIATVSSVNGRVGAITIVDGDLPGTSNAAALAAKLDASQKGAASGVAALDSGSKLLETNIPARLADAALSATYVGLIQAAKNPDMLIAGAVTVDGTDLVTSAAVLWPDGSPGTLTITARHASAAVASYTITYGSPVTKTFTQPTITRNANGAATNVPQIVVS
jgi:hypothetical protein